MPSEHSPTSPKRLQTRERLMDAAYELFAEEGVHATSIEAIAEAAGFTRGAFYSNFESKNELFFALAEREWSTRIAIVRDVIAQHVATAGADETPIAEGVAQLLVKVFSATPDDRTWTLISQEFELLALRDRSAASQYLSHELDFRHELSEVLVAAAAAIGRRLLVDPLEITEIIIRMHESATKRAILAGKPDVEDQARDALLATLPTLMDRLTVRQ